HLGFGLDTQGDAVYLYNAGGTLADSIVFGVQLADLSIGRMPDGSWTLNHPTFGAANVRQGLGDPRLLKINEWLTASQNKSLPDFIELFNRNSLPVNMGGLSLSDAPQTTPNLSPIPALSFVAGAGYAIFIADSHPEDGADHLNFSLSPLQGQIGLFAQDLSLIDCILYGAQSSDVSEGRTPSGSNAFGFFRIPTPGSANPAPSGRCTVTNIAINLMPMITQWSYNRDGFDLGVDWRLPGYDDSFWPVGFALLG